MSRFIFRLRALLRLREAARDQRREQLAEALLLDQQLRDEVARLDSDRQELRAASTARVGPVNVDQIIDGQRYEMVLIIEQQKLAQQIESVRQEIERRREALVEADREVKVLERYRDQRAARHQEQELQRQQKEHDEVAGQRHQREVHAW